MKYQTGEKTLKNIGNKLGNITPTMVNRLFNSAIEKTKTLTNNKPLEFFEIEEDATFIKFTDSVRYKAYCEFISLFKEVEYDIYDFIYLTKKKQYITDIDIKILQEREIQGLMEVKYLLKNKLDVKKLLSEDINKDDNVFTIYQSIISKIAFPNRKRGRPRKDCKN